MKTINQSLFFALVATVLITACGRKGPDAPPNAIPDAFNFTAQANVTPSTVVTSNSIIVSGINTAAQISIMGGEYSIDGGAYISTVGTVANGQAVTVRLTSSEYFGTTTNAVLTIGGMSGIFSVTTIITTTTTTISAPSVQYGKDGSVTVTVNSMAGTPGGSVLLSVDGGPTLGPQQLSGGFTTFTIPMPTAGSHALVAAYLPDGNFQGSSASYTLSVDRAVTTTTISASAVTYGTNGSVTVTVSSDAGMPGGSVALSVDNGTPTTQSLSNGSTIFTIPMPSAGSHTLSAIYAAQGNFGASSNTGTLGVGEGATTMTISSPAVTYGTNGSVTVTVSSVAGIPAGSVSLSVDGTPMTQSLNNGSTIFTIPVPSVGPHTLNATYAVQGNFGASSASGTLNVNQAATMTTISAPAVTYGTDGSVTVTVSSAEGIPGGIVSLSVDNGTPTTQSLNNGSTIFTIPMPSAGSHTLSAIYAALGNFMGSSASSSLNVNQAATTTTISAPAVTYGANGSVTVTVSSAAGMPGGSVSLSVDGNATSQGLNNGTAIFTIPMPSVGSHTLSATYAAQGNFGASSNAAVLDIGVAATTMTISAPDVTYNANGLATITVSSAGVIPSGDVSLSVDGSAAALQTLAGGSTTFTISMPSAGLHTLSATYAAQGDFGGSSASGTLNVNQSATTTSILAPGITYGADGNVTVTVSSPAGTPTGDVSLSVDNGTPTTQSLNNGSTIFLITMPSAGIHLLSATYAAQGNFGASSASGTLGVGAGATSMTLSAPGITYGADGSVTVTVSSTAGMPTGDVSLSVDGNAAVTQTLIGGATTFTIISPSAGSHALNAAYAPQGNFGASSASGALNVNQAATTTTINAPAVTYGTDGSVTVTVGSPAGTPTGDVSLSVDNGAPITQSLSSGSTTFTIYLPSVGPHTLSATYAAQGNFGSSSAFGTLGVGVGATSMTLSAPGILYGADGSVTVTVSSTGVTPTGDVSLSVDGNAAVTQTLSNGSTTFTIPMPSVGGHTLSAAYSAQGNFGASSASGTLIVKAATTTIVTSDLNPSVFKALVTFTATVTSAAGAPSGTVTFSNNGNPIGTGTLSGGTATFSTSALNKGVHSITADYGGDASFDVSTSQAYSQTVQ